MKLKLLRLCGVFFMLIFCIEDTAAANETLQIIDTTPIIPNPIVLLQDEVRYTANWNDKGTDNTITLSQEDALLVMQVASAEALNQGTEGMVKVITVILNRTRNANFPDTVWGVITQEGQFESVANGSYLKAEITPEVHEALAIVEKNQNLDSDIYAFETVSNGNALSKWFDALYKYKDHIFYTLKKD